jgi:hypothetical protein
MMPQKPHPNALQLDQLRKGMWLHHFDGNGKKRRTARVVEVDGETVFLSPLQPTMALTGHIDTYSLSAPELGLVPVQTDDGPIWNGYCLLL